MQTLNVGKNIRHQTNSHMGQKKKSFHTNISYIYLSRKKGINRRKRIQSI